LSQLLDSILLGAAGLLRSNHTFLAFNGLVSQLELLGVIIDHLSHSVTELVVLVLEGGNVPSEVRNLSIILSKISSSSSSSSSSRAVSRVGPLSVHRTASGTTASGRSLIVNSLFLQLITEHPNDRYGVRTVRDLILKVKERLMVTLFKSGQNAISLIDISVVEAGSHAFVVVEVLIALNNLHLNQGELVVCRS